MCNVKWSREQIEKLIVCVEQNSCIYNVKSREYVDRIKKAQAFNSILEELKSSENWLTLEEVKRKWKNLRTQYMQELRCINQSKKSGAGRSDVYVPKLWCFEHLKFLRSHVEIRESADNTEDKENNTSTSTQEEDDSIEEPPKKKHKNLGAVNSFRKDLEGFKTVISQRKAEKKFAWLGHLVVNQMDEIKPEDQADAAWQVQTLMRKLTSESSEKQRTASTPTSSYSKNILELSMEGIFDADDFGDI